MYSLGIGIETELKIAPWLSHCWVEIYNRPLAQEDRLIFFINTTFLHNKPIENPIEFLRQNRLKNPFKNPLELMHKNRYQKKNTIRPFCSEIDQKKKRSSFPGIDKKKLEQWRNEDDGLMQHLVGTY